MTARIKSVPADSSHDPTVNAIIDFPKQGFGETRMSGLLARRPLLKRATAMFAYFLRGEGGLSEPELLELMRFRGANLNACSYCATLLWQRPSNQRQTEPAARRSLASVEAC
jgi:alkylhydroperoxidase family enzyme